MPETPYRTSPFSLRPGDDFQLTRRTQITESGFSAGSTFADRANDLEPLSVVVRCSIATAPLRSTSRGLTLLGLGPDEWMVLGSPDQPRPCADLIVVTGDQF